MCSCHLTAERPSRGQSARAGGARWAGGGGGGEGGVGGGCAAELYSRKGDPGCSLKISSRSIICSSGQTRRGTVWRLLIGQGCTPGLCDDLRPRLVKKSQGGVDLAHQQDQGQALANLAARSPQEEALSGDGEEAELMDEPAAAAKAVVAMTPVSLQAAAEEGVLG